MSIKATRQAIPLARYISQLERLVLTSFSLVYRAATFGEQHV